MKRVLIVIFFIQSFFIARAYNGEYAILFIPQALIKNANAVKRMEKIQFIVKDAGEAVLKRKYAITILNENGDDHAGFLEYYSKMHKIENIEGALFDAMGKELKRLKNKQIIDFTGSDDNNLIDDNRRKFHSFFHKTYPYTIEYEVEIKYNGTLFFPLWIPREGQLFSVQSSSIEVVYPADYMVRYKAFNYPGEPVAAETDKGKKTLAWQISNLPAMQNEYAAPDWYELNPVVFLGPANFEVEGYKGNMTSWADFGKFVYSLKQGKDVLPPAIKEKVHQLTDKLTTTREKISVLYEYMQKNTRYISIQLGIGGWQPFDATYVATKSYGDCKALTNYMYSLLKEAGINSAYTLVKAGRRANRVIADFPSQQFNHVILAVPQPKDTIWLECTSQSLPSGYLGDFTCDRYALMVEEKGGTLVRTPKYGMKENLQRRSVKATLDEEATLNIKSHTSYGALQQDEYHGLINNLSKDKVKEALQEQLDFATYDITAFEYKENKGILPTIEESLDITVRNYASITGKRLFIVPNVMTRSHRKLQIDTARKYDLQLGFEYNDVDTVEISLPPGYTAESVPQDAVIESKFGKYRNAVRLSGTQLFYYRSIEHYSGRFPATDYAALVKFYEAIYKADRSRVVLVKEVKEEVKKAF
jgi:hypothetical protein